MNDQIELMAQIENLVREHLAQTHREIAMAVDRAFGGTRGKSRATKTTAAAGGGRRRRSPEVRRSSESVAALAERLHEVVCTQPGESMTVFAEQLGVSVRELHRPMVKLKKAGRLRTVGQRSQTRYFPGLSVRSRSE